MGTRDIYNKIHLTAQDWWKYYVQSGCLSKQMTNALQKSVMDLKWAIAFFSPVFVSFLGDFFFYLGQCRKLNYIFRYFSSKAVFSRLSPWRLKWLADWFIDVWRGRMLVIQCMGALHLRSAFQTSGVWFCRVPFRQGSAAKRLGNSYAWTGLCYHN